MKEVAGRTSTCRGQMQPTGRVFETAVWMEDLNKQIALSLSYSVSQGFD